MFVMGYWKQIFFSRI